MKLLVVEDERKLAAYLARGLQEEGYQVDVAHTGLDGLHLAVEFDYDLILLDWMLPGVDGFSILQVLRRTRKTPVLMLTAKSDVDDRVRGLRAGADDYLTKPFSFSELIARVEALLRRGGSESADAPQTMFKMADLEVDLVKHRARRGDEVLDLSPKEFSLLKLFLEHPGRALTSAHENLHCRTRVEHQLRYRDERCRSSDTQTETQARHTFSQALVTHNTWRRLHSRRS